MKIVDIEPNTQQWLEWRKGKIGSSKLKDIVTERGNGVKVGIYELIADKLALTEDVDDYRARGHNLEVEAIQAFGQLTELELVQSKQTWVSDIDDEIMVSPDAYVPGKTIELAVEVKCLQAKNHLEACIDYRATVKAGEIVYSSKVPNDYRHQVIQYFIVNEALERLNLIFFNPLVKSLPLHVITVERAEVEGEIEYYRAYEQTTLANVRMIVGELAF